MKNFRRIMQFAALALAVSHVSAAEIKDIRFGVEPGYAPFEVKTADGSLTGFDVDLGNEMCKRLKAKCEWVESDFDGLIPSLKAKKIDAILSSMSITEQRKKEIDFTNKLYGTPARLVSAKGSAIKPTVEALQGKRVGVMQGTTAETYAKEKWQSQGVELVAYQNQDLVYADLVSGRVDTAFQDAVSASESFLDKPQGAEFAFAGVEVNDEKYFGVGAGIGIRKEDGALKDAFNKTLAEMRKDGTYDKLAKKYFKFNIYGE
jgi:lysine-arginine-ornithine-binding protein